MNANAINPLTPHSEELLIWLKGGASGALDTEVDFLESDASCK